MLYPVEDTPDNISCLEQCIEYFHGWYWYRWLYGHCIASQLLPKVDCIESEETFLDAVENGKISIDEAKLIMDMLTQYDILKLLCS